MKMQKDLQEKNREVIIMSVNMNGVLETYATYGKATGKVGKNSEYGKTVGKPELTEDGKKYYEELKKKFSNMDFILVSDDMIDQAKANSASFANPTKTVVLISEEKVEKMATDEEYRKQYEGIIMNATAQLAQMQNGFESTGAEIQGFGIQVDDNGTASYFAVLKKASAAQKERIAEQAAEKKAKEKAADKKAEAKESKERLEEAKKSNRAEDVTVISASSIEELLKKVSDYALEARSNVVQTPEEKMIGQNFDFQI